MREVIDGKRACEKGERERSIKKKTREREREAYQPRYQALINLLNLLGGAGLQAGGADALKGRKKPIAVPHGVAQLVLVWKLRADRLGGEAERRRGKSKQQRRGTRNDRRTPQNRAIFTKTPQK